RPGHRCGRDHFGNGAVQYVQGRFGQQKPKADASPRYHAVHRRGPLDGRALFLWPAKMIKLNKIYTKTGDDGTTGLVDGPRRSKADLRIEAYGTVEEANAAIGLARLHSKDMARVDNALSRIQNDL